MAINCYTGNPGSGKSYEVVAYVIVPAVNNGRRVVTNVDGISSDAIRAYCTETYGTAPEKLGSVVHCSNDDCSAANFLYHGFPDVATIVRPGDLVCLDEAWKFWGKGNAIPATHSVFFREHRHYADPATGTTCDLTLMTQDINDLHMQLKSVIETSFRCKKLKTLGMNNSYTVQMWEGYKQTEAKVVKTETKKYKSKIFPLYSSYVGGSGTELVIDKRQNVLNSKKLWFLVGGVVLMMGVSFYFLNQFFHPPAAVKKTPSGVAGVVAAPPGFGSHSPVSDKATFSDTWRLAGYIRTPGLTAVILSDQGGHLRYESPSAFTFIDGRPTVGTVDGERVTPFSGMAAESHAPASDNLTPAHPPPPSIMPIQASSLVAPAVRNTPTPFPSAPASPVPLK